MFTQEEIGIATQAFSTPINPLAQNAEQYGRTLKVILMKMQQIAQQQGEQFGQQAPIAAQKIDVEGQSITQEN